MRVSVGGGPLAPRSARYPFFFFLTNTAFEPYALEKNHYTKTEADERFALKNELSAPDLSTCIKTTGPQSITSTDFNQPVLHITSSYLGVGDWGSVLKCSSSEYHFEIKYGAGLWYLEYNDIGLMFGAIDGLVVSRAGKYDLSKDKIITKQDLSTYALKTEIPEVPDTSNYLEKRLLSWDINDSREILKLGYCGKEDGTQFYIEDNFQGDNISGWYISSYKDNLYFKQNVMNSMFKTIEFRYNGIFFEGNKLITESEADEKYVLKSELTQYATAQTELDEYVATETLEDVVSQINSKFDSQKRRWTFKLTMNANTNTTTLNLSESIDQYNPVLSNSDGKHVFAYQETNNGFEIIVLTVTLSGITLSVQADKPSKNNYDVYLSFDEL